MDSQRMNASTVETCDVTICAYNQDHNCQAGSISVSMVDGMAHCATFTHRDEATGIGSTEVQDESMSRSDDTRS